MSICMELEGSGNELSNTRALLLPPRWPWPPLYGPNVHVLAYESEARDAYTAVLPRGHHHFCMQQLMPTPLYSLPSTSCFIAFLFRLQFPRFSANFRLFSSSPRNSLHCNQFLDFFDRLLQRCSSVSEVAQIHSRILCAGAPCSRSPFLASRLVSVYARFGLLFYAREVFRTSAFIDVSNLLLWNSIIRANVFHGYYEEALRLYSQMRKLGVLGDGFTLPLALRACQNVRNSYLCKIIHGHFLQMGFQNHLHILNESLGMYAKLGQMDNARKLFDKMRVRSDISWNTMISGCSFNRDPDGAFKIFQWMEMAGFEPNSVTWTSLLSSHARSGKLEETMDLFGLMRTKGINPTAELLAVVLSVCADLAAFNRAKDIHGYVIKAGFDNYLFAKNALICVYGRCVDVKDSQKLFDEMKIKNLVSWNALISSYAEAGLCDEAFGLFSELKKSSEECAMAGPNVISWSTIICGFASSGREEESLEIFRQMQVTEVVSNSVTISSVLSICADLAALNLGKEVHGHVIRAAMDDHILVGNGLINMYAKCGSFKQGHRLFEQIENRDLISWNSMIAGYGIHGFGKKALATFYWMMKSGLEPDEVTFIALLSACSHSGLVNEGCRIYDLMISDFMIEPRMEHYACLVDLLGRAGRLQEASGVVENMSIEPNACVWGALLSACTMSKDVEFAEETASRIFGLRSETSGSYMLLTNIFARNGRWEDSKRIRTLARTKGLKKTAGRSWIVVKKKVHTFKAGSSVEGGFERVYRILGDLGLQIEGEIYESAQINDQDEIIHE